MSATIFAVIVLAIIAAAIALTIWCSPHGDAPKVKSHDAIDEEIRRERLELHNTSLAYADLQGEKDARACMMLAAAFREGAKWQQRRDIAPPPPPEPKRRPECDHERCHVVEGEPGGPYRWSCGRIEG
jgi:hypothetical protein